MLKTSQKTLIFFAGAVWYIGGFMLLRSGILLIIQARSLQSTDLWPWLFIVGGIGLGSFQALTIFTRSCRKNIQRIHGLKDPRIWQFFRPGFFLALAGMITGGILLDTVSQGRYFFMLGVAAVDFTLTISLLGSSFVFWTEN